MRKKSSQRLLLLLLIIITLTVGWRSYIEQKKPTVLNGPINEEWKTYKNDFFTIKYPIGWTSDSTFATELGQGITFNSPDLKEDSSPGAPPAPILQGAYLSIGSEVGSTNFKSYEDFKKFAIKTNTLYYPTVLSKEIDLDNGKCVFIYVEQTDGVHSASCNSWKDGYTYNIYLRGRGNQLELFNTILSTFRFIK